MSRKPGYARHRTDTTAKALSAYAAQCGLTIVDVGHPFDALAVYGEVQRAIDWKTPGGTLTDSQAKLVARGVPVRFVSTPEQVDALAAQMKRDAIR